MLAKFIFACETDKLKLIKYVDEYSRIVATYSERWEEHKIEIEDQIE